MYELLFAKYPQVKPLFTYAPTKQPQIFAALIAAYINHIDNLPALSAVLDKTAHKHVATHVQPEYYPMVGNSLLQAVKEVLGQSATDEVVSAWQEAFFFLADILIEKEKTLILSQTP